VGKLPSHEIALSHNNGSPPGCSSLHSGNFSDIAQQNTWILRAVPQLNFSQSNLDGAEGLTTPSTNTAQPTPLQSNLPDDHVISTILPNGTAFPGRPQISPQHHPRPRSAMHRPSIDDTLALPRVSSGLPMWEPIAQHVSTWEDKAAGCPSVEQPSWHSSKPRFRCQVPYNVAAAPHFDPYYTNGVPPSCEPATLDPVATLLPSGERRCWNPPKGVPRSMYKGASSPARPRTAIPLGYGGFMPGRNRTQAHSTWGEVAGTVCPERLQRLPNSWYRTTT